MSESNDLQPHSAPVLHLLTTFQYLCMSCSTIIQHVTYWSVNKVSSSLLRNYTLAINSANINCIRHPDAFDHSLRWLASGRPIWSDVTPVNINSQLERSHYMLLRSTTAIWQWGLPISPHVVPAKLHPDRTSLQWDLAKSAVCKCSEQQTMNKYSQHVSINKIKRSAITPQGWKLSIKWLETTSTLHSWNEWTGKNTIRQLHYYTTVDWFCPLLSCTLQNMVNNKHLK